GSPIQGAEAREIVLEDAVMGGKIVLHFNPPVRWQSAPHLTVSQSEAGFEKIMQALRLDLEWSVQAGKAHTIMIQAEVVTHG
ncbi:MAG: alpha-amylase/4-alpha-glucanotransferase domain-containing protein, partial [Acidithiobacillus ferrivorans]